MELASITCTVRRTNLSASLSKWRTSQYGGRSCSVFLCDPRVSGFPMLLLSFSDRNDAGSKGGRLAGHASRLHRVCETNIPTYAVESDKAESKKRGP